MSRPDAAYYRAWRAAHPEYRKREAARSAARKAAEPRPDRSAEYRRRSDQLRHKREAERIGPLHVGHELFDRARAVVGPVRSGLTVLLDPLYEDLLSVATLALLEGQDAAAAVRRFRADEFAWRARTAPILWEFAA